MPEDVEDLYQTYCHVAFDETPSIFPRSVSKKRRHQGLRSVESEVLKFVPTDIATFAFPSKVVMRYLTPQAGNPPYMMTETEVSDIKINPEIPEETFTVD